MKCVYGNSVMMNLKIHNDVIGGRNVIALSMNFGQYTLILIPMHMKFRRYCLKIHNFGRNINLLSNLLI